MTPSQENNEHVEEIVEKMKNLTNEEGKTFTFEEIVERLNSDGDIKTFEDLIEENIRFLKGEVGATCYHGGPICDETIPLVDDLITLNKLGFYSTCGQPAVREKNCQQRPFIEGLMQNRLDLLKFIRYLQDNDLYYMISYYTGSGDRDIGLDGTIPFPIKTWRFGLTRYKKEESDDWKICTGILMDYRSYRELYELHVDCYPNTKEIFKNCLHVIVTGEKYGVDVGLEKKLIKYFEMNKSPILPDVSNLL